MINAISYCIAFGLTLSAGVTLLPQEQVTENVQSIIVQGDSQSNMVQNIQAVGGEVLHSFSVIEAVSASLTPQQMEQIKASHPTIRFFADSDVEISASKKKSNDQVIENKTNDVDTVKVLVSTIAANT